MTTDQTTRRYLRDLTVALQLRDVDGARIGEILAEVESHVAESGEGAEEAFGPARQYAHQFAARPGSRRLDAPTVLAALLAAGGGWLVVQGFIALAAGATYVGLPGLLVLAVGAVLLCGGPLLAPSNLVRDPRRPRSAGSGRRVALALGGLAVVVVLAGWGLATLLG